MATDEELARIAELEALCSPAATHRHYMRGYNAANSRRHSYTAELEAQVVWSAARIAELEAENKRLLTDVEASARHANGLSARIAELEAEVERVEEQRAEDRRGYDA